MVEMDRGGEESGGEGRGDRETGRREREGVF